MGAVVFLLPTHPVCSALYSIIPICIPVVWSGPWYRVRSQYSVFDSSSKPAYYWCMCNTCCNVGTITITIMVLHKCEGAVVLIPQRDELGDHAVPPVPVRNNRLVGGFISHFSFRSSSDGCGKFRFRFLSYYCGQDRFPYCEKRQPEMRRPPANQG